MQAAARGAGRPTAARTAAAHSGHHRAHRSRARRCCHRGRVLRHPCPSFFRACENVDGGPSGGPARVGGAGRNAQPSGSAVQRGRLQLVKVYSMCDGAPAQWRARALPCHLRLPRECTASSPVFDGLADGQRASSCEWCGARRRERRVAVPARAVDGTPVPPYGTAMGQALWGGRGKPSTI